MKLASFVLALFVSLTAPAAFCSEIQGRVLDADGGPVRGAAIITRQYSDRMPTVLARTRRGRFHHARAPAVQQHGAAPRNFPSDGKR